MPVMLSYGGGGFAMIKYLFGQQKSPLRGFFDLVVIQ
jgi:hypothetical protein